MAYTFLDLTNKVLRAFNEVELTSSTFSSCNGVQAHAKDCVNDAVSDINQEEFEWPFNYSEQTQVLDSTTPEQEYSLVAAYKTIDWDSFRIAPDDTLEENGHSLSWVPWEYYLKRYYELDNTHTNVRTGPPQLVYQRVADKFGVSPYPDEDYTVMYDAYTQPDQLDAYTDVPTIPERFRNVIELGAKAKMYLFRGDYETYIVMSKEYDDALQNMRTLLLNKRIKNVYSGQIGRRRAYSWKDPWF